MKKNVLSRRTMLRGMAAGACATLALPPLEAMFDANGTAHADGTAIPLRYGVFFWGNGVRPDRWVPGRMGAEWWRATSEELAPIAASTLARDQVSVLTGFDVSSDGAAHHVGRAQILTGTHDPGRGTYGGPTGPSSDWLVASAWEGQTPIRSLELGISRTGKSFSNQGQATSFGATGSSTSIEMSPRATFDRLFGGGVMVDPEAAVRAAAVRQSMVDVVREDAARLRLRLGALDQRRLDAHLDGLRSVERALDGFDAATCAVPAAPEGADAYGDSGHELLEEKMRVSAEIVAMALACDLTRTFSIQYTGMQSDCLFWQVGAEQGSHVLTHDDRGTGSPLDPQYERVHQVTLFVMQGFTMLLEALARVTEGDANVLHHSAIYACSELSDGTSHSYSSMPILLAGRAGGALRSGMHVSGGGRNAVEVPFTAMRAVGLDLESFGEGGSRASRTVDELVV